MDSIKKMKRRPSGPGEILKGLYMEPLGLTVSAAAEKLGVSRKALSAVINGRVALSLDMAMRLARLFSTTPQSWLNAQQSVDLWEAHHRDDAPWRVIKPLKIPRNIDAE